MNRIFAVIITLAYLVQLFSPIVVLAQADGEMTQAGTVTQTVDSPSTPTSADTSSSPPPQTSSSSSSTNSSEEDDAPPANAFVTPEPSPAPSSTIESSVPSPTPTVSPVSPASTPSPSPSPEPSPSPQPSPSLNPSPSPTATNSSAPQSASLVTDPASSPTSAGGEDNDTISSDSTATAEADLAASETESDLVTGQAVAQGDSTNVINTSMQNACLVIDQYHLTGDNSADFSDLECTPHTSVMPQENTDNQDTTETSQTPDSSVVDNEASASSDLTVDADSGHNTVETTGDATMLTGDAIALASLTDIVNSSLTNSQLFYQMFTIWPTFMGDLILPRQDEVWDSVASGQAECLNCGSLVSSLQNEAELDQNVTVSATTGNNTVTGDSTWLETGDAYAGASVVNLVNSQLDGLGWYLLIFNVAGRWNGYLYGWEDGQSQLALPNGQTSLWGEQGLGLSPTATSSLETSTGSPSDQDAYTSQASQTNQATVTQNVTVTANTGHNSLDASGEADLSTGRAVSLANLFSLVNSRISNSRLFVGIINILGDWSGDVRLAYPELAVSLTSSREAVALGDEVTYQVEYHNQGYDAADQTKVQVEIPSGMEVVGYTQDYSGQQSANTVTWNVGELPEDSQGAVSLTLRAKNWDQLAEAQPTRSWLTSWIPQAQAASEDKQVTVTAHILTPEEQSSQKHNQASVTTVIYQLENIDSGQGGTLIDSDEQESDSSIDVPWPLNLQVNHNVATFVYPLDTVTFKVQVTNQGDAPLQEVVVIHQVLQQGEVMVELAFPLGDLPAHKRGQLVFGLEIPDFPLSQPEQFTTQTWVEARTLRGNATVTGAQTTAFMVQPRWLNLGVTPVQAAPPPGGPLEIAPVQAQVLGDRVASKVTDEQQKWWLLAGSMLAFLLIRLLRKQVEKQQVEKQAEL